MAFEDTFSRADADSLGSPWTHLDGQSLGSKFGVRSGEARYLGPLDTAPAGSSPYYSTQLTTMDVGSADMAVEWSVKGPAAGGALYLPFRYATGTGPEYVDDSLGLYSTSTNPDKLYLVAGTSTALGSTTTSGWRAGDTIRAEAVGTAIKIYIDGVLKISATSSVGSSNTRAGFGGNAATNWTDTKAAYHSGSGIGAATVDTGSNIQTVEWEWSALAKGASYQIFRYTDANNMWLVAGTGGAPGTVYLFQQTGGTWYVRSTVTGVTWGPGYTLRVEAGSSNIVVKSGSTTIITYTVSASGGTRAGIGGNMSDGNMPTTRWTRFKAASFEDEFDREYADTLGSPWTTHAGVWGTGAKDYTWLGIDTFRPDMLDHLRLDRFWCSPWPLSSGFRNLGLTRGARSVT